MSAIPLPAECHVNDDHGHATLPLLFLRMVNPSTDIQVSLPLSVEREPVLVLDASVPWATPDVDQRVRTDEAAAQDFTNQFVDTRTKLGDCLRRSGTKLIRCPKRSSPLPNSHTKIGSLVCRRKYRLGAGYLAIYQWLKNNVDAAGAINAMVFFTDGQPNDYRGLAHYHVSCLEAAGGLHRWHTSYANSTAAAPSHQMRPEPDGLCLGPSAALVLSSVGGIPTITGSSRGMARISTESARGCRVHRRGWRSRWNGSGCAFARRRQ